MKLKATISISLELLGEMMFILNSMAEILLSCPALYSAPSCVFKLQSDFTVSGRRQIHYLKKLPSFYLAMTMIFY